MPRPPTIVAIFGPTGIGKTAVAIALAERLRADGEDPVAISADALQLYRGLEILTGAPDAAERERLEHRLIGTLPLTATSSAGEFARARPRRDRRAARRGAPADRRRRHRALPARRARGARPAPARRARDPRAPPRELLEPARAGAARRAGRRAPATAAAIRPPTPSASRALELLDAGQAPHRAPRPRSCGPPRLRRPTLLAGLTMDREALVARIEARVDAMVAAGAEAEVRAADAAGASPGARQALGFQALLDGDVEAMKTQTRRYAKRQLDWMRKLPDVTPIDVTGRDPERSPSCTPRCGRVGMMAAVRFEKWQALGNDYLIVEAAALPFELTPERVRRLCDPHFGPGGDGVLELSQAERARLRRPPADLQPRRLGGRAVGNGAREAILYLRRRGWTDADTFSIETVAGEIRPTITGETTCRVDMGRARLQSKDFPDGPDDGCGEVEAGGRRWRFQHVSIGNPQCAIRVETGGARGARPGGDRPGIEPPPLFPNRTNTSFWTRALAGAIRARIFERGVGETLSSGTGASGAAVAHVLRGGDSPVTVRLDGGELEVDVDESLHVDLTGWAVPVYRGELSPELVAELGSMG